MEALPLVPSKSKSTTLNTPHRFYRYNTDKIILENLKPQSSCCQPKSNFPFYAHCIHFTERLAERVLDGTDVYI